MLDVTFHDVLGNVIHVSGDFALSLLVHDLTNNIAIYHEIGLDDWEHIGGTVEGNYITATVNNFSKYGVFYADATDETTDTADEKTVTIENSTAEEDSQSLGNILPKTATGLFNDLAVGIGILVIGLITLMMTRRKNSV